MNKFKGFPADLMLAYLNTNKAQLPITPTTPLLFSQIGPVYGLGAKKNNRPAKANLAGGRVPRKFCF